jgi:hypothetical protein
MKPGRLTITGDFVPECDIVICALNGRALEPPIFLKKGLRVNLSMKRPYWPWAYCQQCDSHMSKEIGVCPNCKGPLAYDHPGRMAFVLDGWKLQPIPEEPGILKVEPLG